MIWLDGVLILAVFLGIMILGSNRLGAIIQIFALQSVILSLVPLLIEVQKISVHTIIIALVVFVLKGFIMPNFLFWTIRHVSIRREVEPLIGYGRTLLLGGFLIAGSFFVSSKLNPPHLEISKLLVPSAFSLLMIGFLLLVSRLKAITQVIGYLIMENGIFLFAVLLLEKTPLLVEMGILLDILVAVLVMGIVVNHINEQFESTNTIHLTTLKD